MSNDKQLETRVKETIVQEINRALDVGISLAVVGSRGYGKTSTINTLFGVEWLTDPVEPTTRDMHRVERVFPGILVDDNEVRKDATLIAYDFPGLGEHRPETTQEYLKLYGRELRKVDAVLWVLRADFTAYEADITHITKLTQEIKNISSRLVIGLNYADTVYPNDWDKPFNMPSKRQQHTLDSAQEKVASLLKKLGIAEHRIVYYSAEKYWRLEVLFGALINATVKGKKWVLYHMQQNYLKRYLSLVHKDYRCSDPNYSDTKLNIVNEHRQHLFVGLQRQPQTRQG